jgi:hypothetical protein
VELRCSHLRQQRARHARADKELLRISPSHLGVAICVCFCEQRLHAWCNWEVLPADGRNAEALHPYSEAVHASRLLHGPRNALSEEWLTATAMPTWHDAPTPRRYFRFSSAGTENATALQAQAARLGRPVQHPRP